MSGLFFNRTLEGTVQGISANGQDAVVKTKEGFKVVWYGDIFKQS